MRPLQPNPRGHQMIRSAEIRNFRCFRHLSIEGCRRLNLIVGDSGVGKTTLLEAIFLALAGSAEVGLRYRTIRGLDTSFAGSPQRIEEALWQNLFFEQDWTRSISVELRGDGPEARSVYVSRGKAQLTIPLESKDETDESRTAPITFRWKDAAGALHEQLPIVGARGLELRQSDEVLPNFFYFAANQTVPSLENAERFSILRRTGRADKFVKMVRQEYPWIKHLDIEVEAGAPVIHARVGESSRPLALVSGGINRSVGIMLALASHEHSVCLVDEMEDGIFHTHQETTWRALLGLLRESKGQLFATTHSMECITALLRAATNDVTDVALWQLVRGRRGQLELYQVDGLTFKEAVESGGEARTK
jgi:ABC-type lipoprotein export system ATPase subunit